MRTSPVRVRYLRYIGHSDGCPLKSDKSDESDKTQSDTKRQTCRIAPMLPSCAVSNSNSDFVVSGSRSFNASHIITLHGQCHVSFTLHPRLNYLPSHWQLVAISPIRFLGLSNSVEVKPTDYC